MVSAASSHEIKARNRAKSPCGILNLQSVHLASDLLAFAPLQSLRSHCPFYCTEVCCLCWSVSLNADSKSIIQIVANPLSNRLTSCQSSKRMIWYKSRLVQSMPRSHDACRDRAIAGAYANITRGALQCHCRVTYSFRIKHQRTNCP